jgi:hypothetical protein
MNDQQQPESIWIESTRDRHSHGNACLIRWGLREWYAPVADIRATAEDLFTCAAYADLIGELIRADIPAEIVGRMTTAMLKDRKPRYFGTPQTLYLLPGGSTRDRIGAVVLNRQNSFHRGKAEATLTPDKARTMGRVWFAAAEASESDTLFSTVLERAGWMQEIEMDALFGLLSDIRSGGETLSRPS